MYFGCLFEKNTLFWIQNNINTCNLEVLQYDNDWAIDALDKARIKEEGIRNIRQGGEGLFTQILWQFNQRSMRVIKMAKILYIKL